MGKIFYLMGKSSSGKDTIYKELIQKFPKMKRIVLYTTRPRREGNSAYIIALIWICLMNFLDKLYS